MNCVFHPNVKTLNRVTFNGDTIPVCLVCKSQIAHARLFDEHTAPETTTPTPTHTGSNHSYQPSGRTSRPEASNNQRPAFLQVDILTTLQHAGLVILALTAAALIGIGIAAVLHFGW